MDCQNWEEREEWRRKGATLSDKTAREEFGLTQDDIYAAIRAGKLQYREAAMHGNPWLRLLRREVEAFAREAHGATPPNLVPGRSAAARIALIRGGPGAPSFMRER